MGIGKLAAVLGVTACALGARSAAVAASSPHAGKIRVFFTSTSATESKVVITGVIGDDGTVVPADANGTFDRKGTFDKVTLGQGGFLVNATGLDKKLYHVKLAMNTTNCSYVVRGTAPTTIGDGTGAYAGITGKLALTFTFAGIAPKTAKECNLDQHAPAAGAYASITGAGSVSFQ